MPTKIALVGIGKIAVDQHVPALAASQDWELAATVSRNGSVNGVDSYTDIETMLAERPDIPVVSLCLPPVPRFEYALSALASGRDVMLEKPPGATISECKELELAARKNGLVLYATWHSREAPFVANAKRWLEDKSIKSAHIRWRESVRKWHPGQDWVFEPGGMGVFDPGINALSILTEILPKPVHLISARLDFPANRQTPIAAELQFSSKVSAEFDWREETTDIWDIEVETSEGSLRLMDGGARMSLNGKETAQSGGALVGEYPRLYAKMAKLVTERVSEMDLSPMLHISDAFTLGRRNIVEPFDW